MNDTQPSQEELDAGGITIDVTQSQNKKLNPNDPGFVTTDSVPQAGVEQQRFVVPAHNHDDHDSNRIREWQLLQRRERVVIRMPGTSPATSGNYGHFYIAQAPFFVRAVQEVHGTAGTDAGAVSVNIEKLTGTQAPGAGTVMLTTTINMKGTINTVQTGVLDPDRTKRSLKKGDRLALKLTGTPTAVADAVFTVEIEFI